MTRWLPFLCLVACGPSNHGTPPASDAPSNLCENVTCDSALGETCDPSSGTCSGPCDAAAIGLSYVGCEYYPTVTGNMVSDQYHFAVAVANASSIDAQITIDGGALTAPDTFTVPAGAVKVETLPWQPALKLCVGMAALDCGGTQTNGAFAVGGAYHLRATTPVTVYQFNALEYQIAGATEPSYTNDASLLLPANAWRTQYYVTSWPGGPYPSELAVSALHDGTHVTITPKAATTSAGGAPAFAIGVPQTVTLDAGDVIELASTTGDFTGSLVQADLPVQVFGAHYCTDVPSGVGFCDHLEQSMLPVEALGTRYAISAPAVTTIATGKVEVIRIVATAANTTLTYDPPQATAPTTIANAGDFVEIDGSTASFLLTASAKVLVAQYMEGQEAGGDTGDPSMAMAVPLEQFRTEYLFHAPTNYDSNYVDVTAPAGDQVMLDGAPLAFAPIGTTGFGLARINPLSSGPGNDGNHTIQGSMPFGITVYGYGQFTSYWYPGGLDLDTITIQ
jgi:hypothetical protein